MSFRIAPPHDRFRYALRQALTHEPHWLVGHGAMSISGAFLAYWELEKTLGPMKAMGVGLLAGAGAVWLLHFVWAIWNAPVVLAREQFAELEASYEKTVRRAEVAEGQVERQKAKRDRRQSRLTLVVLIGFGEVIAGQLGPSSELAFQEIEPNIRAWHRNVDDLVTQVLGADYTVLSNSMAGLPQLTYQVTGSSYDQRKAEAWFAIRARLARLSEFVSELDRE